MVLEFASSLGLSSELEALVYNWLGPCQYLPCISNIPMLLSACHTSSSPSLSHLSKHHFPSFGFPNYNPLSNLYSFLSLTSHLWPLPQILYFQNISKSHSTFSPLLFWLKPSLTWIIAIASTDLLSPHTAIIHQNDHTAVSMIS